MAKYVKLGEFLRQQKNPIVPVSFAQVERITGQKLPRSARYPAWWSNNPSNNVMTRIWLDAGFKTEQVDVEGKKLVFRRVETASETESPPQQREQKSGVYPFYGALKGFIRIPPDLDLTEPADSDWGKIYE